MNSVPFSIWLALPALAVCYGLSLVIYRLAFHPLARFPGPKFAAATYWYQFYADVLIGPFPGQEASHIEQLHKRYGPVVRINPDELSMANPDWVDVIYKGHRDKWAKNSNANGSPGSVASTVSWRTHKARRAPLSHFFSAAAIRNMDSVIKQKVTTMTDRISKEYLETKQSLPLGVAATALTLDVITEYCFGSSWGCLDAPGFAPAWKRAMTNLFEPVPITKQFPWILQIMSSLPVWVIGKMDPDLGMFFGAKENVQKQITEVVAAHEKEEKSSPPVENKTVDDFETRTSRTIFEAVLKSPIPSSEKQVDRLTDEAFVLVVAGGETTAKSVTNTIYHVLANPLWHRRVLEELDSSMPNPKELPRLHTLENLPILSAIVKETLRVSKPVTNRVQVLDAEHEIELDDWVIPRGTPMSMSVNAIHNNPELYPDPSTFNPGRFLPEYSSAETVQIANRYYMPFHRGPRNCLGQNLAYAETYLAVAALLRRFELELDGVVRERDIDVVRDCFVGMPRPDAQGVKVRVLKERT